MASFQKLFELAVRNTGSEELLEASLPRAKSASQLETIEDDRYLSMMTRCIFRAGFVWRVIDNKWPGFEVAFAHFNPLAVAHFSDERLEELAQDKTIVRNFTKIAAVRHNAVFVLDQQRRHGSFATFIAQWPTDNIVGLWLELKRRGSRLGGNSGPMMLRSMGKDTFLITKDVTDALINHGLVDKFSANSQRDLHRIQGVFNDLSQQSGRSLAEVSRILALTV